MLMGMDIPLRAIQGLIASSVDILIHLGRLPSGKRKILEISELLEFDGTDYHWNPLFRYQVEKGEKGELQARELLVCTERLQSYGEYENYINGMERFHAQSRNVTEKEKTE